MLAKFHKQQKSSKVLVYFCCLIKFTSILFTKFFDKFHIFLQKYKGNEEFFYFRILIDQSSYPILKEMFDLLTPNSVIILANFSFSLNF